MLLNKSTDSIIQTEKMKPVTEAYFNFLGDEYYRRDALRETIKNQFKVGALLGIGIEEDSAAESALGSLLLYLMETQRAVLAI